MQDGPETPSRTTATASASDPAASPVPAEPDGPADRRLLPLHPRAVTLWRLADLGRGVLFAAAVAFVEIVLDLPVPAGVGATAVGVVAILVAAFLPPLQYEAWRYGLREEDLYLRHGVLFRTTSLVPLSRIQHVDTRHGPVDRWLGLASVVVFTAGTRGAILTIPGLAAPDAERLRDRLATLSGSGDAV